MPDEIRPDEQPTATETDREQQITKNGRWQPFVDHCFELYDRFDKSEYRQKKIAAIKRSCEVYAQEEQKGVIFPWKDAFKLILPLYSITLDNLEPRIVAALTGKSPYVKFDMEGMTQQDPETEIIEDWYNSELKHVVRIEPFARSLVHKLLKEGTVFEIPGYDSETKIVRDFTFEGDQQVGRVPEPGTGNPMPIDAETKQPLTLSPGGMFLQAGSGLPKIIEREEQVFEGVKTEILEFNDVLTDDFADDWEKADVIRKVSIPYAALMRKKGQLGYIDKNITADLLPLAVIEKAESEELSGEQGLNQALVLGKKSVDCIECHVSYTWRDEGQPEEEIVDWTEERLVALISKDTRTLLRLVKLRDLRFSNEHIIRRHRLFEEPGMAYGSSLFEKLRGIQEGCSDVFSLFMNVAILIMLPWYLYSNKAGIKQDQAIHPGAGIECDDPSAVMFPKFNVDPSAILEAIKIFFQLHERAGGVGDTQAGQIEQTKKDVKATEIMASIQEGNIKFNYAANTIRDDFIDWAKTVYDFYYQNMPYDKVFPYKGQPVPIKRTSMRQKLKFRLTGSTELSNKLMERKETQEKYGMLRQDPMVNPIPLIRDVVKQYDPDAQEQEYIDPDINMYFMAKQKNPELPQMVKQYLQQKAVQQAIIGGGPGGPGQPGQGQPQGQGGPPPQQGAVGPQQAQQPQGGMR